MKPVWWIPILTVLGGLIGFLLEVTTGWVNTTTGVIVGVLAGAIIYALQTRKSPQNKE